MCGINGYIVRKSVVAANIARMNQAIRHRGPDDEGYVLLQNEKWNAFCGEESMPEIQKKFSKLNKEYQSKIALGFRRLSIIDLSENGHQPMIEGDVCITFNGEIYNFKSIRTALIQAGYRFQTQTDTEVILKGYLHWGIAVVDKLNGMFSIAISDLKIAKTFLIRDRVGLKPLFYHTDGNHFSWCSEMKGLLQADWVHSEMNMEGLILNFQFKTSVAPITCFKNIFSVPPAHILSISHHDLKVQQECYWELPISTSKSEIEFEEASRLLAEKLSDITRLQMNTDVPLVSMMSGGIDSTLITALAHKWDKNLTCYTMSIDGSGMGLDELPQAQKMAQKLNVHQLVQTATEDDVVENALLNMQHIEEPYNSLDVFFTASKYLQEQGFKVILSGNGADEVFGGYGYNLKLAQWRKLQNLKLLTTPIPAIGRLKKLKYYSSLKNVGAFFLSTTGGLRAYDITKLMPAYSSKNILDITAPYLSNEAFSDDYEALFYYDLRYSVGAHHVYHDDICAMRYSTEMRYPYLDHELIALVASLPTSFRYNGLVNKPMLRHIAKDIIVPDNLEMPKKGFSLPLEQALQQNATMKNFIDSNIQYLKSTTIFNNEMIDKIVNEGYQNKLYAYILQLVSTAVWMKKYL